MKRQRVGRWLKSASDDLGIADDAAQLTHFLMRAREEALEQAQLVHDLQRRRVDRVAAEVAQEVTVLFDDQHLDPGARQEKAEHDPGRAAAGDDAGDLLWPVCHRRARVIMCERGSSRTLRRG